MTVVAFVPGSGVAQTVVGWALALADPDEELLILAWEPRPGTQTEEAVREVLGPRAAEIEGLHEPDPVGSVVARCRASEVRLLVTRTFDLPGHAGQQTSDTLTRMASCDVFVALYGDRPEAETLRLVALLAGTPHDRAVLKLAARLGELPTTHITFAKIEIDIGEGAEQAGRSDLEWALHDAGLEDQGFDLRVVVDNHPIRGMHKAVQGQDGILVGASDAALVGPLEHALDGAHAAVVRRAPPLKRRALPDWVPQINPSDYAGLTQQLRQGSRWHADFVVMLALAAAIATLGLLQNSPAVVIGSMLLAPLMTPMIGLGLALRQANAAMTRLCLHSILLGVAITLLVSFFLTLVIPRGETLTMEILSRGSPNILDLLIALFAAVAASFALARPGIAGAVAGVAIATALVPPACSVGISLASGAWLNALGAMGLFVTNLLAIVLASSLTFTLMGVTSERALPRFRRTARWTLAGIALALVLLSVPLGARLGATLQEGKTQPLGFPVTRALAREIRARVAQEDGVELMLMARPSVEKGVVIYVAGSAGIRRALEQDLMRIVRESMDDPDLPVKVMAVRQGWED